MDYYPELTTYVSNSWSKTITLFFFLKIINYLLMLHYVFLQIEHKIMKLSAHKNTGFLTILSLILIKLTIYLFHINYFKGLKCIFL